MHSLLQHWGKGFTHPIIVIASHHEEQNCFKLIWRARICGLTRDP